MSETHLQWNLALSSGSLEEEGKRTWYPESLGIRLNIGLRRNMVRVAIIELYCKFYAYCNPTIVSGNKFYLFLLRFSSYVLRSICRTESKHLGKTLSIVHLNNVLPPLIPPSGKHLFVSPLVTSSKGLTNVEHTEAAHFALQAHIVRHTNSVERRAHLACELHREWEAYAR